MIYLLQILMFVLLKICETYTIATSPDQRVERENLADGIKLLEGVKYYFEKSLLPDKEQVVDFVI